MKFKEYLKAINEIAKEYPQSMDYEVIYSHDDEGNEYQGVISHPCLCKIEKQESYRFLDVTFDGGTDFHTKDCNAIIIN